MILRGPAGRLEALLEEPAEPARLAAVIAHPHPLYGGTMYDPVVGEASRVLEARGAATLRFNFRGVGGSEGEHDRGRGEGEDLAAAIAELHRRHPAAPFLLAGYSFGARLALERLRSPASSPRIAGVLAIAPPLTLADLGFVASSPLPVALVCGELDELTPPSELEPLEDGWPNLVALERVPAAGHDLGTAGWGGSGLLRRALESALGALLAVIEPPRGA